MVTSAIGTDRVEQSIRDYYEKNEPIQIETQDLNLCAIQESDKPVYQILFSDYPTMMKYAGSEKRVSEIGEAAWQKEQQENIAKRVDILVQRWKDKDPFSAFAIYHKTTKMFVGHIVVGHGDKPGEASLAYIIAHQEWNKGYGTQAVEAIVKRYLPALIKMHLEVEGGPFSELTATVRPDNIHSVKILEKVGMTYVGEKEEYGTPRLLYHKIYLA